VGFVLTSWTLRLQAAVLTNGIQSLRAFWLHICIAVANPDFAVADRPVAQQAVTRRRDWRRPFAFSPLRDTISGRNETMANFDRITIDLAQMNGEPCIRHMRLTVRRVLEALALYPDRAELHREYPELEDEDIRQALAFAAANLDDEFLPPVEAR